MGGMVTGTLLAVFFVPVFFVVVRTLFKGSSERNTRCDKRLQRRAADRIEEAGHE